MHFDSDYMNLCHPLILKRMVETQSESFTGYGCDSATLSAKERIRQLCDAPEAEIFFLAGGTQTNMVVIDALLRPHEGVVAADTAHIAIHEAGAIEATGHKVLTLPSTQGKIDAQQTENFLCAYYNDPNWEHIVEPGAVYITHPTEYGTTYSLNELEAMSSVCRQRNVPLYMDGARLGYGLASEQTDISLADIARLCDAFYIGGTKCGAMYGEAVVFPKPERAHRFFSHIKRHGALLAKGWIVGLQFETLFGRADNPKAAAPTLEDTLYYKICRHAIELATKLKEALKAKGYVMPFDSPTNQQFIEVTTTQADALSKQITFGQWEPPRNGKMVIRLATSWATKSDEIVQLISLL